jgi:hypothetical protein
MVADEIPPMRSIVTEHAEKFAVTMKNNPHIEALCINVIDGMKWKEGYEASHSLGSVGRTASLIDGIR